MNKSSSFLYTAILLFLVFPSYSFSQSLNGEEAVFKYLFIDQKHLQSLNGVERVFHQPIKEKGPVVIPEFPWEGNRIDIWSVPVWSEERSCWQMWYWGGEGLLPLYAESSDGLNWEKPKLGLVEWKGSSENNIIDLGFPANGKENRIVAILDNREEDPGKRYKALTRVKGHLISLVSADGLNWKPVEGASIASGDEYRLGYDSLNHRFIATSKTMEGTNEFYPHTERDRPLAEFGRRVSLSVSKDFVKWSEPVLIFWADEVDLDLGKTRIQEAIEDPDRRGPLFINPEEFHTDIYNMAIFTYEGMYLGLPMVFNHSGRYIHSFGRNSDGILYPSLIASKDLLQWDRLIREPFIPHSKLSDRHNFDHGMISALPPVRHGDELWFYYNGAPFTHLTAEYREKVEKSPDEPIGGVFLAKLRIDGFASLHAGGEPGTVVTVPLKVTGPKLYVNAEEKMGKLRIEIRDPSTGRAIPGFEQDDDPINDDPIDDAFLPTGRNTTSMAIQWSEKKDVSELMGRKVLIRFYLENAHLYAFWFDD